MLCTTGIVGSLCDDVHAFNPVFLLDAVNGALTREFVRDAAMATVVCWPLTQDAASAGSLCFWVSRMRLACSFLVRSAIWQEKDNIDDNAVWMLAEARLAM